MRLPFTALRLALLTGAMGALDCSAPPAPVETGSAGNEPVAIAATNSEQAARCLSAVQVERSTERCEAGRTCTGGKCVAAAVPARALLSERAYDPGSLLAVSGEGFLNAFAMRAPLDAHRAEQIGAAIEAGLPPVDFGGAVRLRSVTSVSGMLAPSKKALRPGATGMLTGVVVSPRAQAIEIWAGVAGKITVYLGGKKVLAASGDGETAPLPDEHRGRADLAEGPSPLVVFFEAPAKGEAGLWLRLRAPGHAALPDLLFAPGPTRSAPVTAGDLAAIRVDPRPVTGGFDLGVTASFHGLAPRPFEAPRLVVERVENGQATPLAPGESTATSVSIALRAPLPEGMQVRAGIEGGGERSRQTLSIRYRGELHDRVVTLARKLDALPEIEAFAGDRESLRAHLEMLMRFLAAQDEDLPYLTEKTAEAEALLAGFAAGRDPYLDKTGVVLRAYRSRLDKKLQPYLAFIPPSLRRDGPPAPLVVAMHGLDGQPGQALRTAMGEAPDREDMNLLAAARHLPALPDLGAIVVAPWAYGNGGQRPPAEDDVLRVIEEMKAAYPVDAARVSITGFSLGGTGAFVLPLHYPDVFSAAAPLCGYPNFAQWSSVGDLRHTAWEEVMVEKRSIVSYAENGLHLPLHIVHGGKDGPERSAVIADRYRELGYERIFDVRRKLDHDVWEYGYSRGRMVRWLMDHERPPAPAHVRLVSGEARYDRAHWVRLLEAGDPAEMASIDAEAGEEVTVETRNVTSFALDLSAFSANSLVVDKVRLPACGGKGTSYVTIEAGTPRCSTEAPDLSGKKHAGVAGPLDDLLRHAAVIVYGTGDPASAEVNKLVAEHFHAMGKITLDYPVKADTEMSEADLGKTSLVLIGNPASNRITRLLEDKLPARFDARGVTLRGTRYEGASVGVSLIAQSPRNAEEYVVLHAGVGPEGTLASRHLAALSPDYLVYDEGITAGRGGQVLGARKVLAGGFFDKAWR